MSRKTKTKEERRPIGAFFVQSCSLVSAAIPAVIFYNKFAAESSRLEQRLESFADEFAAIVSRQVDQRIDQPAHPPVVQRAG